ncbi:MAG: histidinol-phosphate transaminase [Rhodospirillales bacterium CG15_BIG_FIL_POST_REV_8_21_14_020_66_15]|nr:MAG: histidinol-phosphate transaminase [Rhodospirillales bacterium CG15_BIG_FIL_POST_REV_8_21_14_020_66_15]
MSAPRPQPGIMEIAPYKGGESKIAGADTVIKLSSNEGAFGPSPAAVRALEGAARSIHRYPDGHAPELRAAIAARYGLEPERLILGAGSDEIINMLCQAYTGPGDVVLYSEHGFLMYGISAMAAGATPVKAPETNLKADVDALLAAVTERTRLLFVANPNNPTGTYLTADEMRRLRDGLRDDVLLVIDGAYAEYVVGTPGYTDGMDMVRAADNVVMTRTFSKMYGLGGARLGWAYVPEAVADVLNRIRGPFNVSIPAQAAGLAAFNDTAFTDMCRAHNDEWLKRTQDALRQIGLFVPDGVGNFVLARFPDTPGRTAEEADAHLKSRGIIARRVAGYGLPDCLRITIGKAEEMEAVIKALREFMGADT